MTHGWLVYLLLTFSSLLKNMSSLTFLYRWLFVAKARQHSKGFTLLELLISLVVASIVVSTLLYMVVELAKIDKREATLDQIQRDMKRAMEYITDDLQEAVYVYPNPERIATELASDPSFPGSAGEVPVLAFWRIDPIEDNFPPNCETVFNPTTERKGQCQALKIRQASYTLVVYSQKVNNANRNWPGQSRIIRYELSQYKDVSTLEARRGYRDPTNSTDLAAAFERWKVNTNGTPEGFSAVLVDYVQTPNSPIAFSRAPLSDADGAGVPAPCFRYGTGGSPPRPLYTVLPSTATTTSNNSFFACVRNPDPDNDPNTTTRTNQDIFVFLRGSVQGTSGGVNFFSQASSLPILETRVLVKGVINKDLADDGS